MLGTIASGQPVSLMSQYNDETLKRWHADGVRLIASHSPGWVNGEIYRDGKMLEKHVNGGECSINDWVPPPNMFEPWKKFQKRAAKLGISYHPWIGQTIIDDGPFVHRVGSEKHHWSLNVPTDEHGPGYAPKHVKGNVHDKSFREEFLRCMEYTRTDFGYQGIWIDSFQNLMMSQLAWSDGSGNSMQRAWWEILSDWSRKGVSIMSESHAFPGISCSIEVPKWEEDYHYFQHIWKWLRAGTQGRYEPEKLDEMGFRFMSNKSWVAPDRGYSLKGDWRMPSFSRFANEYLAALPDMRRSWVLADGKGMLWLPYGSNDEGILYPYVDQDLPAGVKAAGILTKEGAAKAQAQHTYRVSGKDLRAAFGCALPPQDDPRQQLTYTAPQHTWPDWAKE